MTSVSNPHLKQLPSVAIVLAVAGVAAVLGWDRHSDLAARGGPLAALVVAGIVAARLSDGTPLARPVRLASAFVLVALVEFPSPSGALVGLAAIAAAAGGGLAAFGGRSASAAASNAAACLAAETAGRVASRLVPPGELGLVVEIALAFAILHLVAGVAWLALEGRIPPEERPSRALRNRAIEMVNIPLAWLLVMQLRLGSPLSFAALLALLVLGAWALGTLERVFIDLQSGHDALAARVGELATLHAFSREIVASLDPDRVVRIAERECRKLFDLDLFTLALVEDETRQLRTLERADRSTGESESFVPAGDGIAARVIERRRPIIADDLDAADTDPRLRRRPSESGMRSLIAAPLLLEQRVTGVIALFHRRPAVYDDHQLALLATLAQQTAAALENARDHASATVDSVTGLLLRDYLFRRADEEYARARRYGGSFVVLMLDLDGFKEINDRHGHLAGDRYLRAAGGVIRSRLRRADLGGRYGGDEFCLLLPETDLAGARLIAERLRTAIGVLVVDVGGLSARATMSIGMAIFPADDAGGIRTIVQRADEALYRAKRAGGDRIVVYGEAAASGLP